MIGLGGVWNTPPRVPGRRSPSRCAPTPATSPGSWPAPPCSRHRVRDRGPADRPAVAAAEGGRPPAGRAFGQAGFLLVALLRDGGLDPASPQVGADRLVRVGLAGLRPMPEVV